MGGPWHGAPTETTLPSSAVLDDLTRDAERDAASAAECALLSRALLVAYQQRSEDGMWADDTSSSKGTPALQQPAAAWRESDGGAKPLHPPLDKFGASTLGALAERSPRERTACGGEWLSIDDIEPEHRWWRVDNEYVLYGYRRVPPAESDARALVAKGLAGLCQLHNQTVNVWTHLTGAVVVGVLAYDTLRLGGPLRGELPRVAGTLDLIAYGGFLLGAFCCLAFSANFHLFCDTAVRVRHTLIKVDFAGVLMLVWGSWLPVLQFGLSCAAPGWRLMYATGISVLVVIVAVLCLLPRFATPAYQPVRAAVFLGIGWFGAMPAIQLMASARTRHIGIGVIVMGVLYSVGAIIDVLRFPERLAARTAGGLSTETSSAGGGALGGGGEAGLPTRARRHAPHANTINETLFHAGSIDDYTAGGVCAVDASVEPPALKASESMMIALRSAHTRVRVRMGACAPLFSVVGSHAIFHCFVLAAILLHYTTSMRAWELKVAGCDAPRAD